MVGAPDRVKAVELAPQLPHPQGGLSRRRRLLGLLASVLGLPALTGILVVMRSSVSLDSVLLIYLVVVVLVAVVGGMTASLVGAVASFLLANWFLTPPYYTFEVEGRDRLIELVVFVVVAILVSVTVELGARNRVSAERSLLEARLLSRLATVEIGSSTVATLLDQVRVLFGLTSVALTRGGLAGSVLGHVGPHIAGEPTLVVPAGNQLSMVAWGPPLFAEDKRLLRTLASAAARAWEEQRLSEQAAQARELAETDRIRSALLAAVSHDLRTPLAGIKAAVSSLRQTDLTWTPDEQGEMLATIEESTDRLTDVISNLLAMSRIQAGAVSVTLRRVGVDEIVGAALLSLGTGEENIDVPEDLPFVSTDPGLLERVVANLVANARRYSPADTPPAVRAMLRDSSTVGLAITDHGPGVPENRWDAMFEPFQTLGDRDPELGLGIGLAIARGLSDAMNVTLTPSHTPGGGLTMTLLIPVDS